MRERDLVSLLDRFGADLSRWRDASLRQSAEQLLASSAEARAMLARARRLAALTDAAATPPPPPLAALVGRATAHPQHPPAAARLPGPPASAGLLWLGLGRWHAVALASCLAIGILLGLHSAPRPDNSYAVYDVVDASPIGDFHE